MVLVSNTLLCLHVEHLSHCQAPILSFLKGFFQSFEGISPQKKKLKKKLLKSLEQPQCRSWVPQILAHPCPLTSYCPNLSGWKPHQGCLYPRPGNGGAIKPPCFPPTHFSWNSSLSQEWREAQQPRSNHSSTFSQGDVCTPPGCAHSKAALDWRCWL